MLTDFFISYFFHVLLSFGCAGCLLLHRLFSS